MSKSKIWNCKQLMNNTKHIKTIITISLYCETINVVFDIHKYSIFQYASFILRRIYDTNELYKSRFSVPIYKG